MRKTILGLLLALTLVLALPAAATQETFFGWPSFDLWDWVYNLLEIFESESPDADSLPEADSTEPDEPPTSEIGPAIDPGG